MADLVNALEPASLVLLQTTLSFFTTPFVSPVYNFPLFLFGFLVVRDMSPESNEPLRVFSGLVGFSFFFDFIWLLNTENQHGLVKVITILNMFAKIPTFLALLGSLRRRGDRFGANFGGNDHFVRDTVWAAPGSLPTPSGLGAYATSGGDGGASVFGHGDPERGAKPLPTAPAPAPGATAAPSVLAPTMPHQPRRGTPLQDVVPSQDTAQTGPLHI